MRVCPACRGVARSKPLPPEGFWQVQILQRIGMYPYRCEGCGARFYRRVVVSHDLGTQKRSGAVGPAPQKRIEKSAESVLRDGPRIVPPPELDEDGLSHEAFVDLIDHISRSEHRKGLKAPRKGGEDG